MVSEYIENIDLDKKDTFLKLRQVILDNLPKGFEEDFCYNMLAYVVPHSIYPNGYHCKPSIPLPFISLAAQKNSINFYHMGIYADKNLYDWFVSEFQKTGIKKLDMGKSCIRFKKETDIPLELIGQLVQKMSVENWVKTYEFNFLKK